jgi:RNA polymerase sigma factor (sigma-70 family)
MSAAELQQRFQERLEAHRGILFKICNAYCRSRDDREDLAQAIALQLWQSFPRYDERQRFSTWMYRVALNVAISFYRRERTRTRFVVSDESRLLEVIDESAVVPDEVRRLYRLIEDLDPLNKALVLLYLDGQTHAGIADVLGISEANVATKLSRVRKHMRQTVEEGKHV